MRRFNELLERYGIITDVHACRYAPGVVRMLDLNESDIYCYCTSLPVTVGSRGHASAIAYPHPASVDPASAMAM